MNVQEDRGMVIAGLNYALFVARGCRIFLFEFLKSNRLYF